MYILLPPDRRCLCAGDTDMVRISGLEYLRSNPDNANRTILSNVLLKGKDSLPRHRDEACIYSTNEPRRKCGELDVVVVSPPETSTARGNVASAGDLASTGPAITEVWEAKYTVSPSTMKDALEKKLRAVREIMEDTGELIHGREKHTVAVKYPERQDEFTFGLFGLELLLPLKAAREMQAIEAKMSLGRDMARLLEAVKSGSFRCPLRTTPECLQRLRELFLDTPSGFQVVVCIGSPPGSIAPPG